MRSSRTWAEDSKCGENGLAETALVRRGWNGGGECESHVGRAHAAFCSPLRSRDPALCLACSERQNSGEDSGDGGEETGSGAGVCE